MTKTAGFSILGGDLDLVAASGKPFEFEVLNEGGEPIGVFLKVIGTQSKVVQDAIAASIDDERRQEHLIEARNAKARRESAEVVPFKDSKDRGHRLTALKLVGWRGPGDTDGLTDEQKARFVPINEPYSPELALIICQTNPVIAAQVNDVAGATGNFTPRPSKA